MASSSSPPSGVRRAQVGAERRERESPSPPAEVRPSRAAARRAQGRATPTGQLRLDESPATGSVLLAPFPIASEIATRHGTDVGTSTSTGTDVLQLDQTGSLNLGDTGSPRRHPEGPKTTELGVIRGRRAAKPQTSRRRVELALGRTMSNRRIWGGTIALALVLVVPGAAMRPVTVTVADGGLSGGGADLVALDQLPEVTTPDETATAAERARQQAKAAAIALAGAVEKASAKAGAEAAKSTEGAKGAKTKKATTETPTAGNTGRLTSALSGLGWPSGVFARGQGVAGVKSFGEWRGSAVDVVVDWPARESWDDIVNPDWLYRTWKGTPYTKVFGVAPVPEGDGSATMAGCAAGSYNDKWRQFGTNIRNAGLADETVIRLGWEFNGDWYKWSADDPAQFAECWRQIVSSAEQTAPALLWDWNVNRGKGSSVVDARLAYPGDSYVDIVGVDSYDMWPGVTTEVTWARQYSGPFGLKFWSDFARAHGKRISVAEWGVYPGPSSGGTSGGDNAFYIAKMQGFFKAEGSHLAYESYFNDSAAYVAGALFNPTQNPVAAAKYKSLFGG